MTMAQITNFRLLAAVMFIDIVGYTAMMQEDETYAIGIRNKQRKILRNHLAVYHGIVVQYYGDGALIIFNSVCLAVACAIKMQQELQKESIPVRVGIHTGDVVCDKEGVYGDAVNVAARLESLSLPGSVFVSQKVLEELKNQPEIKTVYMGTFRLKNVVHSIKVYAAASKEKAFAGENFQQRVEWKLFKRVQRELTKHFTSKITNGSIN